MSNILHFVAEENEQLIVVEVEEDAAGQVVRREPLVAAETLTQARLLIENRLVELGCSFARAFRESYIICDVFIESCPRFKDERARDLAAAQANLAAKSPNGNAH